jgi:hypothetical protein
MPVPVLVTVSPTSSKEHIKRIRDLIPWLADQVKTSEPYTSHYEAWSTKSDDGEVEFLIYFT